MDKNRIEEILVSKSSVVSGLSEASRARFSWVEVSQESLSISKTSGKIHEKVENNSDRAGSRE